MLATYLLLSCLVENDPEVVHLDYQASYSRSTKSVVYSLLAASHSERDDMFYRRANACLNTRVAGSQF